MVDSLVVSNGAVNFSRLSGDVVTSTGDVMTLIGYAIAAAIVLGVLYAVWLILNG